MGMKILRWVVIILIVMWVLNHPEHASHIVQSTFAKFGQLADSF